MTTRTYTKDDLAVLWQQDLCTHCAACINGLPTVFDLTRRPWVNLHAEGITTDMIRQQVNDCPSGALSIVEVPNG